MYLLIANHRIRTLTSESRATIEGVGEVAYLSVVVKETGRNGNQSCTFSEGAGEVGHLRIICEQLLWNGFQ